MDSNIMQAILNSVEKYKGIKEGKNASYIPYLAEVDPNLCALTVVTKEGEVFQQVMMSIDLQSSLFQKFAH